MVKRISRLFPKEKFRVQFLIGAQLKSFMVVRGVAPREPYKLLAVDDSLTRVRFPTRLPRGNHERTKKEK